MYYSQGLPSATGDWPFNQILLVRCVSIPFPLAGFQPWKKCLGGYKDGFGVTLCRVLRLLGLLEVVS